MTIEQHDLTGPIEVTVDQAIAEIASALDGARRGEVSTFVALASVTDHWAALDAHLRAGGALPLAWTEPLPVETVADTSADDDGLFALDFNDPSPTAARVTITSGQRVSADQVGPVENFTGVDLERFAEGRPGASDLELTRGKQTKREPHVLDHSEPSRLGRKGQHDIDATGTSIDALDRSSESIQFALFRAFYKAGPRGYIDDELEVLLQRGHQSVSAARREMVLQGYVQELVVDGKPVTRRTRSGSSALVRVLTDVARRRVLLGKEPWFTP